MKGNEHYMAVDQFNWSLPNPTPDKMPVLKLIYIKYQVKKNWEKKTTLIDNDTSHRSILSLRHTQLPKTCGSRWSSLTLALSQSSFV